ncbi:hypothetical protein BHE74_00041692 [Ensete ventricosum]|uniref:Uncharacterized protein n=1 Tax=Ensete ventricosum TaxID=4639 RepID=A0A427A148_ENSVE|nr:hypothetical protein B296_00006246 [Ensete ventricosum]RWW51921.1 hypothetical protein BHE74_00041692 [Ensete ventricosum]
MQEGEQGKGVRRNRYKSRGRGQVRQSDNGHGIVPYGFSSPVMLVYYYSFVFLSSILACHFTFLFCSQCNSHHSYPQAMDATPPLLLPLISQPSRYKGQGCQMEQEVSHLDGVNLPFLTTSLINMMLRHFEIIQ